MIRKASYKGWDASVVSQGPLSLVLVPQVGGRIMSMGWNGHDLSFTQPERRGRVEALADVTDVRARKREMGLPLWGGEKTWLAPQSRWTDDAPFLDLDSGAYEMTVQGEQADRVILQLSSPVCRETGVRIIRTVQVGPGVGRWSVTHEIANASSTEVVWGIWDVAMVMRPGRVYLPKARRSPHAGGVKTYPEEGESTRLRDVVVTDLGDLAVVTCDTDRRFKFGVDTQHDPPDAYAWMLGILEVSNYGLVGYRKVVPLFQGRDYAHGCVAEVFNAQQYPYLEMEIHGPVVALKPGEAFKLIEQQALFDVTDWPTDAQQVRRLALAGLSTSL